MIEALLRTAEKIARKRYHGHLSILRFTTHWKAMFETPDLDTGDGRSEIRALRGYPSLEEALLALIEKELGE